MFSIPGFDPKTFSDDQIVKKMQDLNQRISYASRFSASFELVAQLQNLIAALDFERRERAYREAYDMRDAMLPDIIETDPEMREESNAEKAKKEQQSRLSEDRPRKSKRPVRQPALGEGPAPGPELEPIRRANPGEDELSRDDHGPLPR